ncbi:MAG: LysE family translocator [Calditrichota bacterium]
MIPLVFSPGPINIIASISGAQAGFRNSIPFLVSVNIVYIIYALITGFGVGELLATWPILLLLMQLGGGAFIIWQGIAMWRRKREADNDESFGFREGFILQALNPKVIIVLITMFSAFLQLEKSLLPQVLMLSAGALILNIMNVILYAIAGVALGSRLKSPELMRKQDQAFSVLLVLVGVWIVFR